MRPPSSPADALVWIKEAVATGNYMPAMHLFDRMAQRGVSLADVKAAIASADRITPHDEAPEHGGTCWRVAGCDTEGDALAVGVEAYASVDGKKKSILITVFGG